MQIFELDSKQRFYSFMESYVIHLKKKSSGKNLIMVPL